MDNVESGAPTENSAPAAEGPDQVTAALPPDPLPDSAQASPLAASSSAPPAPEPARRARPRARVVVAWCLAVVVLIAAMASATFVHISANETFDASATRLDAATDDGAEAHTALTRAVSAAERSLVSAEQITAAAADDLVDPAARAAFADAIQATSATAGDARTALEDGVDDGESDKPFWTWELFAEASVLDERSRDTAQQVDDLRTTASDLDDDQAALDESAGSLYASAAAAASALEAANVSARAETLLDFRDAASTVAAQTGLGPDEAVAFSVYASRAASLKQSAQAELAEKAGPLLATRLEIEAYARSISGGVVLDFDWAPIVAGAGGALGIGGTATWNSARGGFSTITLSHSVAEWWPDADSRALVAHEVGHAITSKCYEKFDSQDPAANEEWATAWAISMGHTAIGNGVQAYGYPSQDMIDLAATCR